MVDKNVSKICVQSNYYRSGKALSPTSNPVRVVSMPPSLKMTSSTMTTPLTVHVANIVPVDLIL